jgi:hypothetical protein
MSFTGVGAEGRRNKNPSLKIFGRLAFPDVNSRTMIVTHPPGNSLLLHRKE